MSETKTIQIKENTVNLEDKKRRLKEGGFIQWTFCTEDEKTELRKLGALILNYGGVTTARLKR